MQYLFTGRVWPAAKLFFFFFFYKSAPLRCLQVFGLLDFIRLAMGKCRKQNILLCQNINGAKIKPKYYIYIKTL